MVKRMLIDATHAEESRVVVINGNRLEEYDVETSTKKQLKGNIYLAKVTRVEPSLQAAFVEYGGNRHGFLAFSEIHSDYYQIPVADREAMEHHHAALAVKDAEIVDDNGDDGETTPKKDKKPARSRSRRKPRGKDAAGSGDAVASDAGVDGDNVVSADADENTGNTAPEDDAKPRRRRPRNRRKKAEDGDATASADDNGNEGDVGSDDDGPKDGSGGNGGTAAMAAEIAELSVDVGNIATVETAHEDIEDFGGDDADEFSDAGRPQMQKRYKIQEVIKRRQILLVQVVKEERGNKGAALTTFLSLAGRYCVLMPNTPRGGGISRKITNAADRKRLKSILAELEIPGGMAVIVRTAGSERTKVEIKRDFDYMMRLWDRIRETTLESQAPCLIYEEADLIKRSIRDLYARDVDEVLVEGDEGYRIAKDFMKMLMPSHAKRVQPYKDQGVPLFHRFQVESQLDAMLNPVVQLKSGGYIVINPTEALVAIDVNSGRSTRERNIEETAYKTNLEAAEELARQLRLRDLAGLIVIDFIDMEDHRNQGAVERKLKEAMRNDRARLQIGRISPFGLLEMSRQRLRPSLVESAFEVCSHCRGVGLVRSIESAALHLLRMIEEEGMRRRSGVLTVHVTGEVALYVLNRKRDSLLEIEKRYGFTVMIFGDDSLISPDYRIERTRAAKNDDGTDEISTVLNAESVELPALQAPIEDDEVEESVSEDEEDDDQGNKRRRRRRRRRGRNDDRDENTDRTERPAAAADDKDTAQDTAEDADGDADADDEDDDDDEAQRKRRRRGKRGGRRRSRRPDQADAAPRTLSPNDDPAATALRRDRPHTADDGTEQDVVIDADTADVNDDDGSETGVNAARERDHTAPAPARPRRERADRGDRNENRRGRRDRRPVRDAGDVRNIPIQSGPAPETSVETVTAPAPQTEAPAEPAPTPKPTAPQAVEKVETPVVAPTPAPTPAQEAKPEAEKPVETPTVEAPASDEAPKPKKRGWWSLGK
ncbi:Rne/Rng family ribonuclease [Thalassospira sp.]|uniref:Rne/Rng family ribonuclease n=1 Tax=Thalassospira sp. TaxID=1912094 RepID=UPI002735FFE0|nr:Rne/Rng family ribonuclease [Thalassospira sp.]MDP2700119.1 Rne/Rng family ribonuclease [Thalassospira sp.]